MFRVSSLQRVCEGDNSRRHRRIIRSNSSEGIPQVLEESTSSTNPAEKPCCSPGDEPAKGSKWKSMKALATDMVPNMVIAFLIFLAVRPYLPGSSLTRSLTCEPISNPTNGISIVVDSSWPDAPPLEDSIDLLDLDLTPHHRRILSISEDNDDESLRLAMTIFCAPKPYLSPPSPDDPQRRALLSWMRLVPQPSIVLLGNDSSFHDLAKEFPGTVSVEPFVDANFYGVPLFHSMVARAQAAATPLSLLINGDIILLSDILPAIRRVSQNFESWLLTAARWDVKDPSFPFSFEAKEWEPPAGEGAAEFARRKELEIRRFVRREAFLHSYGGVDLWVWNNDPSVPLVSTPMPPFAFGRGKYDNWLVHEAIASGLRHVIDGSDAVTSIHVAHSYAHVKAAEVKAVGGFWSTRKKSSWELFGNIHMAQSHGSYENQKGTALHAPWKLTACWEPEAGNLCLLKRERPATCSCEYSPYHHRTQSDPRVKRIGGSDVYVCGVKSVDKRSEYAIQAAPQPNGTTPGLPHTLAQLLPQVARNVTEGITSLRVVTLVAVTVGYAEMLMNFVCNLRQLGLADNLLIAALDEDMYRFAFTQGLPVYYEDTSVIPRSMSTAECHFGTPCFRQFTKLKSRAVLHVLQAGYSVLWTDVDIVWFDNPLPELMAFGPGTLPIQSNEPNASLPGNGFRRINSGFYFARSDEKTIAVFAAIVAHAATTSLSEQPSFYDVLCGEKGQLVASKANGIEVVKGREECVWTNGLRTVFLPRDQFPNGASYSLWAAKDVRKACDKCMILHNNWISGKDAKKNRLVGNGFWYYDGGRRICIHPWHDKLIARNGGNLARP